MQDLNERKNLKWSGGAFSVSVAVTLFFVLFLGGALTSATGTDSDWYKYVNYLLPQISIAVSLGVFLYVTKTPVKKVVFEKCKWWYFGVAILLQFGLLSLTELNGYFVQFLMQFGYTPSESHLPSLDGAGLVGAILVIALLPAVFEESLFRGVIVGGMKKSGWGTLPIVLISGALFSIYHGAPEQTLYQFICGMCFALIALRSGSILPTALAHFINNAFILVMTSFGLSDFPESIKLPLYITSGAVLVAVVVFLVFFVGKREEKGTDGAKEFFFGASFGILMSALLWGISLWAGFNG